VSFHGSPLGCQVTNSLERFAGIQGSEAMATIRSIRKKHFDTPGDGPGGGWARDPGRKPDFAAHSDTIQEKR
jgi:hypothetical protein